MRRARFWRASSRSLWGIGARAPLTSNNFIFSSLWSKSDSQLSKYCVVCVVCEISWCRCQQLTALSASTALVTKLLVIEQLLDPALKFAVIALWPTFQFCRSSQQILATPLATRTCGHTFHILYFKCHFYRRLFGFVRADIMSMSMSLSYALLNKSSQTAEVGYSAASRTLCLLNDVFILAHLLSRACQKLLLSICR